MKRFPLLITFLTFILLCMSLSFWGLRMFKPQPRGVVLPESALNTEALGGQWGQPFGNAAPTVVASNYQLKGIILARNGRDSVAIIAANGKPAQSVMLNHELLAGVSLVEVHDNYVTISEGGLARRLDLPQASGVQLAVAAPVNRGAEQFSPPAAPPDSPPPVQNAAFPVHNKPAEPAVVPGLPVSSLPGTMPDTVK